MRPATSSPGADLSTAEKKESIKAPSKAKGALLGSL